MVETKLTEHLWTPGCDVSAPRAFSWVSDRVAYGGDITVRVVFRFMLCAKQGGLSTSLLWSLWLSCTQLQPSQASLSFPVA